ncbi:MAG: GGDEF domain-containing protein [Polyangiaceae bacterium]|nr:GGDEF domain-containing protein [Polyangiaceae bacterium]
MPEPSLVDDDITRRLLPGELRVRIDDGVTDRALLTCASEPGLGRTYPIVPGCNIIGRAPTADICVPLEVVSRRHAQILAGDDGYLLTDLGSTNGTVCDGQLVRDWIELRHGSRIVLGGIAIFGFGIEDSVERRMRDRLYELATRDPLTRAYNRRFFCETLQSEWSWAARHCKPCAVLMLDLDRFKHVNDAWGHAAGDHVLEAFAAVIQSAIRKEDSLARLGGEEFGVLCRATDMVQAALLAERLRSRVQEHHFVWHGTRIPVTMSVGIAISAEAGVSSVSDLLARSDERLYAAKSNGRNVVALRGG